MKNYSFLLWAYNVVWLGIGAYLVFMFLRLRKVSDRLDRLERRMNSPRRDERPGQ